MTVFNAFPLYAFSIIFCLSNKNLFYDPEAFISAKSLYRCNRNSIKSRKNPSTKYKVVYKKIYRSGGVDTTNFRIHSSDF